jgi:mannose-6-phosphate isomerase-like protein (cupin superfamily)
MGVSFEAAVSALGAGVRRPWGWYVVLDAGREHQVKRLTVRAGCRLSYQRHARRSEHWFVVAGQGQAIVEGRAVSLGVGEALDIPCGSAHRLGNPGPVELVVVEVQTGRYLGEDDIVRLEDDYARAGTSP